MPDSTRQDSRDSKDDFLQKMLLEITKSKLGQQDKVQEVNLQQMLRQQEAQQQQQAREQQMQQIMGGLSSGQQQGPQQQSVSLRQDAAGVEEEAIPKSQKVGLTIANALQTYAALRLGQRPDAISPLDKLRHRRKQRADEERALLLQQAQAAERAEGQAADLAREQRGASRREQEIANRNAREDQLLTDKLSREEKATSEQILGSMQMEAVAAGVFHEMDPADRGSVSALQNAISESREQTGKPPTKQQEEREEGIFDGMFELMNTLQQRLQLPSDDPQHLTSGQVRDEFSFQINVDEGLGGRLTKDQRFRLVKMFKARVEPVLRKVEDRQRKKFAQETVPELVNEPDQPSTANIIGKALNDFLSGR